MQWQNPYFEKINFQSIVHQVYREKETERQRGGWQIAK